MFGLVALGVSAAALLPRLSEDEPRSNATNPVASQTVEIGDHATMALPNGNPNGTADLGGATRRITEGCDAKQQAAKYEDLIGQRALAALSWHGASERVANLQIPLRVQAIQDGVVVVNFERFPADEIYIGLWIRSGHVGLSERGAHSIDPCSATFKPWPSNTGDSAEN